VAPQNTKGGIGSVLHLYTKYVYNAEVLYTYPETKYTSRFIYFLQSLGRLAYKMSTDKDISIVHVHTASRGSFYRKSIVLLLSKLFLKKVILHIHGGGFKSFMETSYINRRWCNYVLRLADLNICLSEEWYTYFTSKWRLNNIAILPNPIAIPSWSEHNYDRHKLKLLYLGTVVQTKGIFDLIDFFSSNSYFLENKIVLHIGGEGDLVRLRSLVDKYKMNEKIIIHGWMNAIQKDELFRQSDVYILPSYAEGLPMSILEAMSYAKPIIATHVGGIPSLVKKQTNGWLFDPNDFTQLQQIFDDLFQQPQQLSKFSHNSYQLAKAYDIKKIAYQLEQLYENIITT
jgi:glycosyltransferase involved in cell wall biosynthesis